MVTGASPLAPGRSCLEAAGALERRAVLSICNFSHTGEHCASRVGAAWVDGPPSRCPLSVTQARGVSAVTRPRKLPIYGAGANDIITIGGSCLKRDHL